MAQELFERVDRKVGNLINEVVEGKIGLPDLQRPFVWSDSKVRDLLDSMMKGFPVGYVMLWASPKDYTNTKTIGNNEKQFKRPDDLVIDGQQRLTSLLAAITGTEVRDKNFEKRHIKISFNPLTREFQVWTYATERDFQLISDISKVYAADENHQISKFRRELFDRMNEGRSKKDIPILSYEEMDMIESNINLLLDLRNYTIPTLRILADADEEDVAEIFRRVNSGGQKLNENNFIETLLAVYDNDIHDKIMNFCADARVPAKGTSYNNVISADPSHIIRVAVSYGFHRARMKYGYKLLRGIDLESGVITEETRLENLDTFRIALERVVNLNDWHSFLNLFPKAGYVNKDIIRSEYAVIYSYVLYLIGKYEYNVPQIQLQNAIIRWIFMSTITSFYSGAPESKVERQLADLRQVKTADQFVQYLDDFIKRVMNESYFSIELIESLNSSSANSPVWYGYIASLNVIGMPMLFSTSTLSSFLVLGADGQKKSIDKHHIFPKHYLEEIGIADDRARNQMANFTYLDYQTNIDISDDAPADYVGRYKEKLGAEGYQKHCENNALPLGFENMEYFEFLTERRKLMAGLIRKASNKLWE